LPDDREDLLGLGVYFDPAERVLTPGTPVYRLYSLLGLLALAGVVGFVLVWLGMFDRRHPVLYLLVTLAVLYYLAVWAARWLALRSMRRPRYVEPAIGLRVGIATSFVPELEPIEMLEQTVRRLVAIEYPHETWVLDEGDDPAVKALCERLGAHHFSRRGRPEYQGEEGRFASQTKFGNYNAWLDHVGFARYEVIVTFDPDHVAQPNYLTRLLGHFKNPAVGYVQAPQVYYNQDASFIARGGAEETYFYYSSHLMASCGLGHTVVIGTHCAHRVTALQAVGGFPAHDAEDLNLTMLYRARGWEGVYVPEILAMGTAPVDWNGYLGQQARWARSVLDLKLSVLPRLSGKLTRRERVLNLFHGSYYFRPLLLLPVYAVLLAMLLRNDVPRFLEPGPLLALASLGVLLSLIDRFRQQFLLDPERERGFHWRALLLQVAKAPHFAVAVIEVLLRRRRRYRTTPKVRASRPDHLLTAFHVGLASLVAAFSIAGFLRHGRLEPVLIAAASAFLLKSAGLALTELWNYPAPFEPGLWAARHRTMFDVLGPIEPDRPDGSQGDFAKNLRMASQVTESESRPNPGLRRRSNVDPPPNSRSRAHRPH
jgi:hypothetical protein